MKEVHGYSLNYHRYKNKEQNSDILMIFIYYKGEYIDTLAFSNGKQLSI